jgi:hypothetical protein
MGRRMRKFLPIVLIAVMVQILAPIGACWAAGMAASDPVSAAVICHDHANSASGQSDHEGQTVVHDGCCSVCSVAHTGAPTVTPEASVLAPLPGLVSLVWFADVSSLLRSRTGSQTQARAPPLLT